jgi:hypothetical protein
MKKKPTPEIGPVLIIDEKGVYPEALDPILEQDKRFYEKSDIYDRYGICKTCRHLQKTPEFHRHHPACQANPNYRPGDWS